MPMSSIPLGTLLHNMNLSLEREAISKCGTYVQLIGRDQGYSIFRLTSGEVRLVCHHVWHQLVQYQTQIIKIQMMVRGRSRWLGKRPHVRGVAMNPIDHPHGGGEGRTSGGRHPVTPWGSLQKVKEQIK